jgi:HlyD family secretion protein
MPITTIYLDAMEGGRVEERYAEDGAMMTKGQPILRLSNTDLMMSLVEQQNGVYNNLMQEQIAQNGARQNAISNMNQMADVEQQLQEAKRLYDLNEKLYQQKALDYQDYQQSKISYEYLVKKEKLQQTLLLQDSVSREQQMVQQKKLYDGANEALGLMQKKVGDLIVRAPVDGQLTSLDAEVGQNKPAGTRLGQIDVISDYKVRVDVDEHYINNVFPGLAGSAVVGADTLLLTVKKVYPSVTDGKFQVDMGFVKKAPNTIHRGQSLQITLTLGDDRPALLLPRGGFYQQTGGNWIFKLSKDGVTAYKADIQIGGQNPDYYEVLKGLQPGDKVVTSSYENFGNNQELIIK